MSLASEAQDPSLIMTHIEVCLFRNELYNLFKGLVCIMDDKNEVNILAALLSRIAAQRTR